MPWFSVTTGNDGTGHLQIGRPGNYPNRLTLDVTATGSTLVYDGDIYTGNGNIAGWTINRRRSSARRIRHAGQRQRQYSSVTRRKQRVKRRHDRIRMISHVSNPHPGCRLIFDGHLHQPGETLAQGWYANGRSQLLRSIAQVRHRSDPTIGLRRAAVDANLNYILPATTGTTTMEFNGDTLALQGDGVGRTRHRLSVAMDVCLH